LLVYEVLPKRQVLEVLGGVAVDVGDETRGAQMVGMVEEYLVFVGFGRALQHFEGFDAGFSGVESVVVEAHTVEIAFDA
jgi:hypothetical protein